MSAITQKDVEHVARLARLALTPAEKETFAGQIAGIIAHISKLNELDTTGVTPMSHAVPLRNVTRADQSRPSWPKEQILANAPAEQDGFFRVPRILEEE